MTNGSSENEAARLSDRSLWLVEMLPHQRLWLFVVVLIFHHQNNFLLLNLCGSFCAAVLFYLIINEFVFLEHVTKPCNWPTNITSGCIPVCSTPSHLFETAALNRSRDVWFCLVHVPVFLDSLFLILTTIVLVTSLQSWPVVHTVTVIIMRWSWFMGCVFLSYWLEVRMHYITGWYWVER